MTYRPIICRQSRPGFQPQCSHLTMTRLYGVDFICESCHRPGPFGWVYRCTQDREELIEEAASKGFTTAFDGLGYRLTEELGIRKGSPAARDDKFSFLTETSPQMLATYRPDQLATILRQRENLKTQIHKAQIQKTNAVIVGHLRQASGEENDRPKPKNSSRRWVCADDEECQFKVCPFCRPSYGDRSFLSLDSILGGELPPTAATGFGFHVIGERPVVDASIVRMLGLRRPSLPCSESTFSESSYTSDLSVMEMLDDQLRSCRLWSENNGGHDINHARILSLLPSIPGKLTHSPRCDNLEAYGQSCNSSLEEHSSEALIKAPAQHSSQGETSRSNRALNGFKINCVVVDHVGSISSPEPDEKTDYLIKISGPRAESP